MWPSAGKAPSQTDLFSMVGGKEVMGADFFALPFLPWPAVSCAPKPCPWPAVDAAQSEAGMESASDWYRWRSHASMMQRPFAHRHYQRGLSAVFAGVGPAWTREWAGDPCSCGKKTSGGSRRRAEGERKGHQTAPAHTRDEELR